MAFMKSALISTVLYLITLQVGAQASTPPPAPISGRLSVYAVAKMDIEVSANGQNMVGTQKVNVTFVSYKGQRYSLGTVTIESVMPLFNQDQESLAAARIAIIRDFVDLEARGFSLTDLPSQMRIQDVYAKKENALLKQFLLGALRKKTAVSHRQPARLYVENQTKQYIRLTISSQKQALPPPIPTEEYKAADLLLRSNYDQLSVYEVERVANLLLKAISKPGASAYAVKRAAAIANDLQTSLTQFHDAKVLANTVAKENEVRLAETNPNAETQAAEPKAEETKSYWSNDEKLSVLRKNLAALRLVDTLATKRFANFKVCDLLLKGQALEPSASSIAN